MYHEHTLHNLTSTVQVFLLEKSLGVEIIGRYTQSILTDMSSAHACRDMTMRSAVIDVTHGVPDNLTTRV